MPQILLLAYVLICPQLCILNHAQSILTLKLVVVQGFVAQRFHNYMILEILIIYDPKLNTFKSDAYIFMQQSRIDAETLQIRAIQLTTNNVSDSQVLGDLLDQIPQDEQIDSVYTDGAYDTKQCRQVIADRQAHAVIPPRKNAKPWKDTKISSLERNELLRTVKRLGRRLWKKWSGYHRRSLVETKMHCIKLLGDKLMARSFPSQVNEIHARVAVLNRFTELGRPLTQVTP